MAVRREPRLILTAQGFALTSWLRSRPFHWSECYDFHIRDFAGLDVIYFRRRGYKRQCGIINFYDCSAEAIVHVMDERSRSARDAGKQAVAADRDTAARGR
jgi:hypothetical protein